MENVQRPAGSAKRIYEKFQKALTLPSKPKVSLWGNDSMMSPRAAKLLSDPETRDLLLRATRGEREQADGRTLGENRSLGRRPSGYNDGCRSIDFSHFGLSGTWYGVSSLLPCRKILPGVY